jgi:hypothetical protein
MSPSTIVSVAFHGATILAVLVNGIPHVSIRSICEALGLNVDGQIQRIKRHPVLAQGACVTHAPSAGGDQQVFCLPLDKLNGWLFGVSAARVRPELRERLVQYQRECFDVLAEHFGTKPAPMLPAPKVPVTRRWLMCARDGDRPSFVELDDDIVIGTWGSIAHTLRHQPHHVPKELVLGLAEAATRAAFHVGASLPRGPGDEIAQAIRKADLSIADLHAIASTATMEVWGRALDARDAAAAQVKTLIEGVKA